MIERRLDQRSTQTGVWLATRGNRPQCTQPAPDQSRRVKARLSHRLRVQNDNPPNSPSAAAAATSHADLMGEPATDSRVVLAPTQLFSNAPDAAATPPVQPSTDAIGVMHLPSTPAGLGDARYSTEETASLHPVTGTGSGNSILRRNSALPFTPLTPPDAIPRSLVGFGQLVTRPTLAQLPEQPHYASDAWEDHLSEVQGSASGSMPVTNTPVPPTESQLRVQPFTPAIPTEYSHHAGLLTLDGSWDTLLATRPGNTLAGLAVRHPNHIIASQNLSEDQIQRLLLSNSHENRAATLLTSTEELPRVGSPEGIAGARTAVAAALARNRSRYSTPFEMATRQNADDYD